MTEGTPWRHTLRFALPVLAGALLQQLYNTADMIIVGRFAGEASLSAVGTTGSFIYCEYTSGKKVYKGYISSSYLKKANYNVAKENTNITTVTSGGIDDITMTVINCTDWVSLREKASASAGRSLGTASRPRLPDGTRRPQRILGLAVSGRPRLASDRKIRQTPLR